MQFCRATLENERNGWDRLGGRRSSSQDRAAVDYVRTRAASQLGGALPQLIDRSRQHSIDRNRPLVLSRGESTERLADHRIGLFTGAQRPHQGVSPAAALDLLRAEDETALGGSDEFVGRAC